MRTSDCLPHQVRAVPSVRAALARRVQQRVLSARGAAPAAIAQDGAALLSWLLRRVPTHQLSAVSVENLAALLDEATSTRERSAGVVLGGGGASGGAHHGAASGVGGAQHGAPAAWSEVLDLGVGYQGREARPPLAEANLTEQLEVGILCDLRIWARACPEAQLAHLRLLGERLGLSPRLSPRCPPRR